jgi:lysozyme
MKIPRKAITGLTLSAAALVGIVMSESYTDRAVIPVPGDVLTIGFGSTAGVKIGDKITPHAALKRVLVDVQKFEGAVKTCVKVPLTQNEYDAYLSLSYNIGTGAFCRSTLVRKLNTGDYAGACSQILAWDKFKGKPLRGLTLRREREYQQCLGLAPLGNNS